MRRIDILASFELEINKLDDTLEKPATDDSLYWLNEAVIKFVKQRFNGDSVHNTSFELNEKRRIDLIKLFTTKTYSQGKLRRDSSQPDYDAYKVVYPEDFLFVLSENVVISDMGGLNKTNTGVFECTQDNFMYRIKNNLTDFHYRYHRARPLRIRNAEGCSLLTDKKYRIDEYTLGYLRKPNTITLDCPFDEYEDFDDVIMPEIIKIAAQMYLENSKDERYKTFVAEVSTQE